MIVHPSGLEPETNVPKTFMISISPWVPRIESIILYVFCKNTPPYYTYTR